MGSSIYLSGGSDHGGGAQGLVNAPEVTPELVELTRWLRAQRQRHDQRGCFDLHLVTAARAAGVLVPVASGRVALASYAETLCRLAAADPSAAFVVHQHQCALQFCAAAGIATTSATDLPLTFVCSANSEPGMRFRHTAERKRTFRRTGTGQGAGGILDGRKHFCSGIDIASHICSLVGNEDGGTTLVLVPRDRTGLVACDDWVASGLRATGSRSVNFRHVLIEPDETADVCPYDLPRRWWWFGYALVALGTGDRSLQRFAEEIKGAGLASDLDQAVVGACALDRTAARAAVDNAVDVMAGCDRAEDRDADAAVAAARTIAQLFAENVCLAVRPYVGGGLVHENGFWSLTQRDVAALAVVPPSRARVAEFLGRRTLGLDATVLATKVQAP